MLKKVLAFFGKKQCSECFRVISLKARRCPHCTTILIA